MGPEVHLMVQANVYLIISEQDLKYKIQCLIYTLTESHFLCIFHGV